MDKREKGNKTRLEVEITDSGVDADHQHGGDVTANAAGESS